MESLGEVMVLMNFQPMMVEVMMRMIVFGLYVVDNCNRDIRTRLYFDDPLANFESRKPSLILMSPSPIVISCYYPIKFFPLVKIGAFCRKLVLMLVSGETIGNFQVGL